MRRFVALCVVAAVAAISFGGAKDMAAYKKTALVRIPMEFSVKGTPDAVWQKLTHDRTFMTLTGFTPSSMMPAHQWEKIGDATPATMGSDGGVLVVTRIDPSDRELRVTFEPADGGYLCHHIVRLSEDASGAGTRVVLVDRYTDDKATVDKTARDMVAMQGKGVAAFRAEVEAE